MTDITALPISDLAQLGNVAFTSLVQTQQYQQAGFAFHTWMLAMGATVEASSNGTTASLADNIAGEADIVPISGAPAGHTWIQYLLGTMRMVIDFTDAAVPDQSVTLYRNQGTYNTNGTTTTKPTAAVADREGTALAWNLIGWAAPVAGTISYQYSATEKIGWFFTKQNSQATTASFFIIERCALADTFGDGIRDWFLLAGTTPAAVLITSGALGRIGGFDGTAGPTQLYARSVGTALSAWTNGAPADGKPRLFPMFYAVSVAATEDRRSGGFSQLALVAASTANTNQTNPADPVADPFSWRILGRVGFLWKKSDGVIL